VNVDAALKVHGRPPSVASTSSSEISVANDNVSQDLVHDFRTKVSSPCVLCVEIMGL